MQQLERICFNSLQTGRYIQSIFWMLLQMEILYCFNSLQTGRYIQSQAVLASLDKFTVFQFPSNGKVYTKKTIKSRECCCWWHCFNSLQTGRYIQSPSSTWRQRIAVYCFNSLQTGRYIQRLDKSWHIISTCQRFNSLQTGRYIQRLMWMWTQHTTVTVSIPFKREGIYKVTNPKKRRKKKKKFQFPSNGKVYTKERYQDESQRYINCFNSLQTGRYIQSSELKSQVRKMKQSFNSLQTGRYIQRQNTRKRLQVR